MSSIGKIHVFSKYIFIIIDFLLRAFSSHVHELNKISQLMEIWQESFEHFNAVSVALSEAIRVYHSPPTKPVSAYSDPIPTESPYLQSANILNNVLINAQECLVPAVRDVFSAKCVKPVFAILSTVQPVQDELTQRKSLLLDFDSYRIKLEKEVQAGRDSTHPQVVKKAAKLDESAKKLHQVQSSICHTFFEFESARYHALGPELASFLGCLHSYSAYLHSSLSDILPMLPQSASTIAAIDSRRFNISSSRSQVDVGSKRVVVEPVYARKNYEGGRTGGYDQLLTEQQEDVEQLQSPSGYTSATNSIILSRPVSGIPPPPSIIDNPALATATSELSFDDDVPIATVVAVSSTTMDSFSSSSGKAGGGSTAAPPPKPPKPPRPTTAIKSDTVDTTSVIDSPHSPEINSNVDAVLYENIGIVAINEVVVTEETEQQEVIHEAILSTVVEEEEDARINDDNPDMLSS